MEQVDAVRLALLRPGIRDVAARTQMPEQLVAGMLPGHDWQLALVERSIHEAMLAVDAAMRGSLEKQLQDGCADDIVLRGRPVLSRAHVTPSQGVVLSCVS